MSAKHTIAPCRSKKMKAVNDMVRKAAETDENTLICGEGGTGKELIAREIHYGSARSGGRSVVMNCSAVPISLAREELFGRRGPECKNSKAGALELAEGGTLLIDEICGLPLAVQRELAGLMGNRRRYRKGSEAQVRIIASTSVALEDQVARGAFREDLLTAASAVRIDIPPLRERIEDIPLLSYHFLRGFAERVGRKVERISEEAMALLRTHPWPGNASELRNAIERAVLFAQKREIGLRDIAKWLSPGGIPTIGLPFWGAGRPIPTLEEMKVGYMKDILKLCGGNKCKAARLLGITPVTLRRRLGAG